MRKMIKPIKKNPTLSCVNPNAAGIDIGANMLITNASVHIQHMQKALSQMNLQIHHVLTDITGMTGMKIIRAIVAGERNAQTLASYRHEKCHSSDAERSQRIMAAIQHVAKS